VIVHALFFSCLAAYHVVRRLPLVPSQGFVPRVSYIFLPSYDADRRRPEKKMLEITTFSPSPLSEPLWKFLFSPVNLAVAFPCQAFPCFFSVLRASDALKISSLPPPSVFSDGFRSVPRGTANFRYFFTSVPFRDSTLLHPFCLLRVIVIFLP